MKHRLFHLILFVALVLSGSPTQGQGSVGAGPKKARTLEDYKPSTLKEIMVGDAKRDGLMPFRVRVTYTASARAISTTNNDALHDWAQCCAGNPDHYKGYVREMQFVENGAAYWLGVQDGLILDFQKEVKAGEAVDLFLIRLSAPQTSGKRGSVLLIERFQGAAKNGDQMNEPLGWIVSNLPSYAEKDLKVEVAGSCRLKITDPFNSVNVSKAVVFIPLTDLDISKVSVEPRPESGIWDLWLHTVAGKNSIRFMLYQGGPAEGGQASKYSLTFRDREKAEAMAERFRRVIDTCAGATVPLVN